MKMARTHAALTLSMTLLTAVATNAAIAQDTVKIGMSFAMTGAGFNAAGRQAAAGARLYLQQHGDTVAGKKDPADTQRRRRRRRQCTSPRSGNDRQR